MRRGVVEVVVALLDVLAVIAFVVGQAKQPLLQDRIATVPQRQGEAEPQAVIGNAGDAVLAPPVRARPRLIVRTVIPGIAGPAAILADRAPLPLAEVRSPFAPCYSALSDLCETNVFPGFCRHPPSVSAPDRLDLCEFGRRAAARAPGTRCARVSSGQCRTARE